MSMSSQARACGVDPQESEDRERSTPRERQEEDRMDMKRQRPMKRADGTYVPWVDAGGADECKHGIARVFACERCDEEDAQHLADPQPSPVDNAKCQYCNQPFIGSDWVAPDGHGLDECTDRAWWEAKQAKPVDDADPVETALADMHDHYGDTTDREWPKGDAEWDHALLKKLYERGKADALKAAKPVDNLGELERLAKEVKLAQYACGLRGWFSGSDEALVVHPLVDGRRFIAACSPDRIQSLIHRVREAEKALDEWTAIGSRRLYVPKAQYDATIAVAEQSLQAEREKAQTAERKLAVLFDSVVYSDSYGVEGSSFSVCRWCGGGSSPGKGDFKHNDGCLFDDDALEKKVEEIGGLA